MVVQMKKKPAIVCYSCTGRSETVKARIREFCKVKKKMFKKENRILERKKVALLVGLKIR